jgi:hypothetical protein
MTCETEMRPRSARPAVILLSHLKEPHAVYSSSVCDVEQSGLLCQDTLSYPKHTTLLKAVAEEC